MRILTVRQPWAWAIIHGGKDVENRVHNLAGNYRGPVAIHAGMTKDPEAIHSAPLMDAWQEHGMFLHFGAIIGVVDLVGAHRTTGTPLPRCYEIGVPNGIRDSIEADRRLCSVWADSLGSPWHLELANPRPLAEPIPYKGALGLRHLDGDTVAKVLRQIERAAS